MTLIDDNLILELLDHFSVIYNLDGFYLAKSRRGR
jgi:hypothetical protein